MAQLADWLLSIPAVCGLNLVNGKIYIEHLFAARCIEKTKIRLGMAHFEKLSIHYLRRYVQMNR